ncbi:hypothetical protein [Streptomyces sp. YS415]|uniref:hypothetical protein n=1 Tax=Streptomyces sp. YS415 TaxID=2944806 RepID=UPI0020207029|nr:hypothetical protein [Streptomyces sp. YS415]MCL7430367.1 hypothetical protein [Streptomyces sp. YS415]
MSTDLPVTARQVFYRLVRAVRYPEEERAYDRLQEALNRARRARLIPTDAIRDDRAASAGHFFGYNGPAEFWDSVRASAFYYSRPLDEGQPRAVEVWIEAQGMMPTVAEVTQQYGVVVYCFRRVRAGLCQARCRRPHRLPRGAHHRAQHGSPGLPRVWHDAALAA